MPRDRWPVAPGRPSFLRGSDTRTRGCSHGAGIRLLDVRVWGER